MFMLYHSGRCCFVAKDGLTKQTFCGNTVSMKYTYDLKLVKCFESIEEAEKEKYANEKIVTKEDFPYLNWDER